jgi:14-3-3 protein epsilon
MTDPTDLAFYTEALLQAARYSDAISCIERLISAKPSIDAEECRLFERAFKTATKSIRRALRMFMEFYVSAVEARQVWKAEMIQVYRASAHSELNGLCCQAIGLLRTSLLPNAESPKATVFFHKLLGDYWRYIAEYESGSEYQLAIQEAEKSYRTAIEFADHHLLMSDPMRLGAILHFAIFKFELIKSTSEAADLLLKARAEAEIDLAQLTPADQSESLDLLTVIRVNLGGWLDEDDPIRA